LASIPTRSRRRYARYALRQGVVPEEAGPERLAEFYALLAANRARHHARPTHSLAELQALFAAVPERVKLFLFTLQHRPIAAALVFALNPRVAYAFYLCHDERFEQYRATSLAVAHVMEHYTARGFRYLDLGPSTFDDLTLNRGLAEFKEEFGATGFCRDTYRWEVC
jgi:lipid II:glycine glycyltransferase (peptidoglycan interpeptide bridge formation enzyme)